MSMSDLENRLKGLINTIRVAIKPELAIPKDQEKFPINYRITRIKDLLTNVSTLQEELNISLKNITTNLEGLLEDLNTDQTAAQEDKPVEKVKEEKKPAEKKNADKKPAPKAEKSTKKTSPAKGSKSKTAAKKSDEADK